MLVFSHRQVVGHPLQLFDALAQCALWERTKKQTTRTVKQTNTHSNVWDANYKHTGTSRHCCHNTYKPRRYGKHTRDKHCHCAVDQQWLTRALTYFCHHFMKEKEEERKKTFLNVIHVKCVVQDLLWLLLQQQFSFPSLVHSAAVGIVGFMFVFVFTIACSKGTTWSLWICLMLLACPLSAFSRAPRGYKQTNTNMKRSRNVTLLHLHIEFLQK